MDKIFRILLLGGESSGKSTMAKAIAEEFGAIKVDEYGRTFYEERPGKEYEYDDLEFIAYKQLKDELAAFLEASFTQKNLIVCDTSLIVTYFYSMQWFDKSAPVLNKHSIPVLKSYDAVFLCRNDFPFVQDGSRQNIEFSTKQYAFYEHVLEACSIPFVVLSGSVATRLNTVRKTLQEIKWKPSQKGTAS